MARQSNPSSISAGQILLARLGVDKMRDKFWNDNAGAVKFITEYLSTLNSTSPEYNALKYYLEDKPDKIVNELGSMLRYSDGLLQCRIWEKFLTRKVKNLIKEADLTHYSTSPLHAWAIAIGGKDYDLNSDEIPVTPDNKLHPDIGVGVLTVTREEELLQVIPCKRGAWVVECEITSWKGISIGAEHYYARLNCFNANSGLKVVKVGKQREHSKPFKVGDMYNIGGTGDDIKPRICRLSKITVRRPLNKTDLKETKARGNVDRYEGWSIGDMIDGFWTEESAIDCAKKTFERIFDSKQVQFKLVE